MEDIKTIIWALEHYDFKLDCVPEKVVNMINELLNGYKKLQQENTDLKQKLSSIEEIVKDLEDELGVLYKLIKANLVEEVSNE